MSKRYALRLFVLFLLLVLVGDKGASQKKGVAPAHGKYEDLVNLFKEFREFQKPKMKDGVPDYTPKAIEEQKRKLAKFEQRLAAIDESQWTVSQKVDYHLVRAEMNGLEFDHRVLRPWSRDPAWYVVIEFQFGPKMYGAIKIPKLPLPEERVPELRMKLQAVSKILEQAKKNLKEPTADLTLLGIRAKERESTILNDFIPSLAKHHHELVPDAEQAKKAIDDFRIWLERNKGQWKTRSGIGIENYNWFLKNVYLLAYAWDEILAISEREYERAMAMIKLEEHKNRSLPPLKIVESPEEYIKLFNESQKFLLYFLKNEEIFSVPDYIVLKPVRFYFRSIVRDYFQQILDRDPLPLQPHDFVGHSPDTERHKQDKRPIRGVDRLYFIDGIRAEAVATGMEEILMHLGLLDKRPRARELCYNLLAFRAARAISDLKMHSNELTLMEAFRYNIEHTPYGWLPEDSQTMWHDIELYLRQPAYGIGYLIGSVQLQKLIADRALQLGEKFRLRQFMDEFLEAGMIPISLIRWEMTGLEDEMKKRQELPFR